jgi:hypothetical protein
VDQINSALSGIGRLATLTYSLQKLGQHSAPITIEADPDGANYRLIWMPLIPTTGQQGIMS